MKKSKFQIEEVRTATGMILAGFAIYENDKPITPISLKRKHLLPLLKLYRKGDELGYR